MQKDEMLLVHYGALIHFQLPAQLHRCPIIPRLKQRL